MRGEDARFSLSGQEVWFFAVRFRYECGRDRRSIGLDEDVCIGAVRAGHPMLSQTKSGGTGSKYRQWR